MTRDLLARAFLLGLGTGSRNSLAVAGPVLATRPTTARGRMGRVAVGLGLLGELIGDKLPRTPSRLEPPGPAARIVGGGIGAVLLARRATAPSSRPGAGVAVAVASGTVGAALGIWGGAAWRRLASDDGRRPDWPGALAEDAVALTAAYLACRPVVAGPARGERGVRGGR